MDQKERQLIQDLFARLRGAEGQIRDPEAERLISEELRRAPHAPYTMAQIILAQNQALETAASRIEELESRAAEPDDEEDSPWRAPGAGQGAGRRSSVPAFGGRSGFGQGGGFLANAGQMAVGVAGGMLLGELAKNLLGGGSQAQAATPDAAASAAENPLAGQAGAGDVANTDDAASEEGGGFLDWLFGGGAQDNGGADGGHDLADSGWDDGGGWDGGE